MKTFDEVLKESEMVKDIQCIVTCRTCREEFGSYGINTPEGVVTATLCPSCYENSIQPPTCDECGRVKAPMYRDGQAYLAGYACRVCDPEYEEYRLHRHRGETDRMFQRICPAVYQNTSPELLPFPGVIEDLREWNRGLKAGQGLLLHGGTAKGKTRVSWLLVYRYLWHRKKVIAYTGAEFANHCSLKFSDTATGTDWLNKLIACDLLFIDDLGKASFNEHRRAILFELVEKRIAIERATIITLNESAEELEEKIQDAQLAKALYRRFKEFYLIVNFFKERYQIEDNAKATHRKP